MKRWGSRLPSPALPIACLALFVALGGTVLAATKLDGHAIRVRSLPGNRLAVGSVPGNRLRRGAIPGNRLKPGTIPGDRLRPGSVPGDRLAPGSVKGEQVDAGSLAQVPSAAHADAADTARRADTATAADHAADATTINGHAVGCAAGLRQFAGACWEPQVTPIATTAIEAAAICGAVGGELPSVMDLLAFTRQPGARLSLEAEWTNQVVTLSDTAYNVFVVAAPGVVHSKAPLERNLFRCVTPLLK